MAGGRHGAPPARLTEDVLVPLRAGEYELLLAFLDHPQRVLSRDQLLDLARGRNASPFDRSVDVQVAGSGARSSPTRRSRAHPDRARRRLYFQRRRRGERSRVLRLIPHRIATRMAATIISLSWRPVINGFVYSLSSARLTQNSPRALCSNALPRSRGHRQRSARGRPHLVAVLRSRRWSSLS